MIIERTRMSADTELFNSQSNRVTTHVSARTPLSVIRWLLPLLMVFVLTACGGSGEGLDQTGRPISENPPVDNTPTADFGFLKNTVLVPVCTVCHAGGAAPVGLRLDSINAYDMLVGVDSVQVPGVLRVAPGDPDNSYLIQKIEGTAAVGVQMPLGGPPLSSETIALFRQWISEGAQPEDTSVPPSTPPTVVLVSPEANVILTSAPTILSADFSQAMDASLVSNVTFELRASGTDGTFADGNETLITPVSVTLINDVTISMDISTAALGDDVYEARLIGTGATALADLGGLVIDGDNDGNAGGDYVWQFTIDSGVSGPTPTWRWIQDNVFSSVCIQCHVAGGVASFLLLDEANSYSMTVNQPSGGVPTLDLIQPLDADASYLVQKLEGTAAVGGQMPLGGTPLEADVISAIKTWINAGALLEPGDPQPDVTAPNISLDPVADPVSGVVTLSAMATDDTDVSEVRFYVDGVLLSSDNAAPYEASWDTTTASDGAHVLTSEADDAAGNTGISTPLNVTVTNVPPADTTAPVVSVTDPGSPLSGTVNVTTNATDDTAVTAVRLYIDDTLVQTFTTVPYEYSWDSSGVANGVHTLRAEADDAAGNTGVSTTVSVTVDNGLPPDTQAPTVSINALASPTSGTVDVTLTAEDNTAVTIVRLFVNSVLIGSDTTAPYSVAWDTTTLANGTHLLSAEAEDAAGNVGFATTLTIDVLNNGPQPTFDWIQTNVFSSVCTACHINGGIASFLLLDEPNSLAMLVNVPSSQVPSLDRIEPGLPDISYLVQKLEGTAEVGSQMPLGGAPLSVETIAAVREWIANGASAGPVDTLAPVVTFVPPVSPLSGVVTIAVDAVDDVAVSEVRLLVNGVVIATDTMMPYSLDWNTTLSADGTYTLVAEAEDSSGNIGASQMIDVVVENGMLDIEVPVVSIDSLVSPLSGSVTVTVQASDNVGVSSVELQVDGVAIGADTAAPYEFEWDTTTTNDGAHSLTATAVDVAGNAGNSNAVNVMVDNSTPADVTAPLVSINPVADPVGGVVMLAATATDDTGVIVVRFFVDGVLQSTDTTEPFEASWDSTSVADGSHTLSAEAEDAAGNVGVSSLLTITVMNNTGPQATWRWIQDNIFTTQCVFCHVAGGVADFLPLNEEVSYSQLVNVNSTEGGPQLRVLPGDPDNSSLVGRLEGTVTPQMPLGGAPLPVDQINAVRQWILDGALPETPPDTMSPVIEMVSPGETVSGEITLIADATDDTGVSVVRFYVDETLLLSDSIAPFQVIWDTTQVSNTMHTLRAEADDAAGNTAASPEIIVTVDNTLPPDATPPTVTITPLSDPVSGIVAVEIIATDDVGVNSVTLSVDGVGIETDFLAPYIVNWNTLGVINGQHTLTATATDAAGNEGTSDAVFVNVLNTAPQITITLLSAQTVSRGDDFTVTATINNLGSDSNPLTATLSFTPPDALRIEAPDAAQTIGELANDQAISVQWLMRADEQGDAAITVTVTDIAGAISEQGLVTVTVIE